MLRSAWSSARRWWMSDRSIRVVAVTAARVAALVGAMVSGGIAASVLVGWAELTWSQVGRGAAIVGLAFASALAFGAVGGRRQRRG